jgi:hypothetical protein
MTSTESQRLADETGLTVTALDGTVYRPGPAPCPVSTWAGLMAGCAPAPTDRTTTNTGDTGGPTEADGGPG